MFLFKKRKKIRPSEARPADAVSQKTAEVGLPEELSKIKFSKNEGSSSQKQFVLFGLTTCGFCRKAVTFLTEHNVSFYYIYVDKIPLEQKKIIREYVSNTFNTAIAYPFLVVNNKKWISGFLRVEWEEMLKK
jgi:glutaredoxin-like protein NrdH